MFSLYQIDECEKETAKTTKIFTKTISDAKELIRNNSVNTAEMVLPLNQDSNDSGGPGSS